MIERDSNQFVPGKFHILVSPANGLAFPEFNLWERVAVPIDADLPPNTPSNWSQILREHASAYKYSTDIYHNVEMFHLSGISEEVHQKATLALSKGKKPSAETIAEFSAELDKKARELALEKFRGEPGLLAIESEEPLSPEAVTSIERTSTTHQNLDIELAQYGIPANEGRAIKQAYRTLSDLAISYFLLLIGEDAVNNKLFSGRYDVFLTLMTYIDMAMQHDLGEKKRLQQNGWAPLARIIHALENSENYPSEELLSGDVAEILSTFSQLLTAIEDRYFMVMLDSFLTDPLDKQSAKKTFPEKLPLQKLIYAKSFFLHSVGDANELIEPKILPMMEHYGHKEIADFLRKRFQKNSVSVECSAKSALRSRLETGVSIREQMLIRGLDPSKIRQSEWGHELIKWIITNQPDTVLDPEIYFSLPETIRGRLYIRGSQFNELVEIYSKTNFNEDEIPYRRGPRMSPVHIMTTHKNEPTTITKIGVHHPFIGNATKIITDSLLRGGFGMLRAIYDVSDLHLYGTVGYGHIEIQFFPHVRLSSNPYHKQTSIQRLVHAQRKQYIDRRNRKKY